MSAIDPRSWFAVTGLAIAVSSGCSGGKTTDIRPTELAPIRRAPDCQLPPPGDCGSLTIGRTDPAGSSEACDAVGSIPSNDVTYLVEGRGEGMVTQAVVSVYGQSPAVQRAAHARLDQAPLFEGIEKRSVMDTYATHHRVEWWKDALRVAPLSNYDLELVDDEFKLVVMDEVARLSIPVVGWPGLALNMQELAIGDEIAMLEKPIAALADIEWHGRRPVLDSRVAYRATRHEAWGEALLFEVELRATLDFERDCSRLQTEMQASGELVLRASDGGFVSLHLSGPVHDRETPCPRLRKKKDASRSCMNPMDLDVSAGPCRLVCF